MELKDLVHRMLDNDLKQLMSTPNAESTSDTVETYNKNLLLLAQQELSGKTGPEGNSIRTGVFVENLNADNSYIASDRARYSASVSYHANAGGNDITSSRSKSKCSSSYRASCRCRYTDMYIHIYSE